MANRQDEEFRRFELPFSGLFGRKLHAIDCQGLFCELDKYCREALPELTSARSRIKAKYAATANDISLFFPPKRNFPNNRVMKAAHAVTDRHASVREHVISGSRTAKHRALAIRDC